MGSASPCRKWAWLSAAGRFWLGASRRGGGACARRRGRGRLPIPLPRAALSARREATAVGSFAGLCSGDFGGGGGGGASGTSALVSSARRAGPLGSEPGGRTRSRSTCRCRLTGAGGAWGRAGRRGVGWGGARGAGPRAGGSPGQCAEGWGRGCCRSLGAWEEGVGDRTPWPGESEPGSVWGGAGCPGKAFWGPEPAWPGEEPRAEWRLG